MDNIRTIKRRGFSNDMFDEALQKAQGKYKDPRSLDDTWPRTSDSADPGDRMGHEIKPDGKYWNHVPVTEEEKAIYYGLHFHSIDNKFGLHTHIPGGELTGGHTHGPQNRFGVHHHKNIDPEEMKKNPGMYTLDGHHIHASTDNKPCGPHGHFPENMG